jgi:hypothetical protein
MLYNGCLNKNGDSKGLFFIDLIVKNVMKGMRNLPSVNQYF